MQRKNEQFGAQGKDACGMQRRLSAPPPPPPPRAARGASPHSHSPLERVEMDAGGLLVVPSRAAGGPGARRGRGVGAVVAAVRLVDGSMSQGCA
eukprot:352159-Chlamydomonas_euryale.AAC.11